MSAAIDSPPPIDEDLDLPGVFAVLGQLGPSTWITVEGLAQILGKDRTSVRRAIEKGQLPEPVKMLSNQMWTLRVLTQHIEQRLGEAAKSAAAEREQEQHRQQETAEAQGRVLNLRP